MKMNPARALLVSTFVTTLALLGACSSTPPAAPVQDATPTPNTASPQQESRPPATQATPAPESQVRSVVIPPHLDPNNPISTSRSVFFEFDDDSIKQVDLALLERHAKYLASNPALTIKIEGNTDERGSSEYNLALGQRRAQSVLRAMKIYGVPENRMEAVSWGEERPRAAGHDEASWAQNRRADLAYPAR